MMLEPGFWVIATAEASAILKLSDTTIDVSEAIDITRVLVELIVTSDPTDNSFLNLVLIPVMVVLALPPVCTVPLRVLASELKLPV